MAATNQHYLPYDYDQWKSGAMTRYYVLNCEDKAKETFSLYLIELGHPGPFPVFVFEIFVVSRVLTLYPQTTGMSGTDDIKLAYDLLDPRLSHGVVAYDIGIIEASPDDIEQFFRAEAPTHHDATPAVFDSLYNRLMGLRYRVESVKTGGELLGDVIAYMKQAHYKFQSVQRPDPRHRDPDPIWMQSPETWTWP